MASYGNSYQWPLNQNRKRYDRDAKYDKYGDREQMEAEIEKEAIMLCNAKKLERIVGFKGYFDFMNLEYQCPVYFEGAMYASAAHAYHAAKSNDEKIRRRFQKMPLVKEMLTMASTLEEPEDWKQRRLSIMEIVNRDKFRRNKELREKLDATLDREIINVITDENDREDSLFWGVISDQGQNQLGRILEKIRHDFREGKELDKWVWACFRLQEDRRAIPIMRFDVSKNNEVIEKIELEGRPYFVFGSLENHWDVVMLHPSISRTHAILIVDSDSNVMLIDPGSKAGTKIDGDIMKLNIPYILKNGQVIKFGESTREYKVQLDYSKVSRSFELEKNRLENDLKILEKLEGEDLDLETLQKSLGINKNDTVWVGNLIPSVTEEDIRELFEDWGKIMSIRIPEDRATRQKKGFAFITFVDDKAAKNALARDGIPYYKKSLKVSIAENKPDLEFRGRGRQEEEKHDRRKRGRDRYRSSSRGSKDSRRRRRPREDDRPRRRNSPETYREYKRQKYGSDKYRNRRRRSRSPSYSDRSSSKSSHSNSPSRNSEGSKHSSKNSRSSKSSDVVAS